jgi:hypothetical protein
MGMDHQLSFRRSLSITNRLIVATACLLAGLLGPVAAWADENVTSTGFDPLAVGTLPYAVANVTPGDNVIFQPAVVGATIDVAELDLGTSMSFVNNSGGAVTVRFSGSTDVRPMVVDPAATFSLGAGLTLLADYGTNNVTVLTAATLGDVAGTISSSSAAGQAVGIWNSNPSTPLHITGDLSGNISSEGQDALAILVLYNNFQLDGDLSGNLTSTATAGSA